MTVRDATALAAFLGFMVVVIAFLVFSFLLDARLQELIRAKAWRGFKFRLVKFYPQFLAVIWGVMPWELAEIADRARADPRYRKELRLARILQGLYVLLIFFFITALIATNT